ncbi:hypothetical protein BST95_01555 [Halioglobus japonicus]|uniref:TetR/AcrR family transcriptional regulator n=1 Tax=Halioglobus japonicus TaxID=930805 RepID=A0AAP8SLY3_9GAMM|nr:TetR/AcrR family transcriptional regulator [Halioglobus japonicus]AQA17095.1 hypothetical protein BST95_01555 [Halioglobus japonicus]PLW85005.1 TetR/AcrR family transcriptional regulator [Halioglobus japonicus]
MTAQRQHESMSRTQQATREKILHAAWNLLDVEDQESVNMMDIAKGAGIGRATLYRYYETKEFIIRDLTLEWGRRFSAKLFAQPLDGVTVGERICYIVRSILVEAYAHPHIIRAALPVIVAKNESMSGSRSGIRSLLPGLVEPVIADIKIVEKEKCLAATHRLLLGSLYMVNSGSDSISISMDTISFTLRKLLGERAWQRALPG